MELVRVTEYNLRGQTGGRAGECAFLHSAHLSLRCDSGKYEQSDLAIQTIALMRIETSAYLTRSMRHHSVNDLPCHAMAQVIVFYSRLSPRQPRATLKTKNKRRALRPAVY
ncbi:hypothetical protein [Bradyrhizobium japonicum]|uniref:hypothetical protein n=1 Tax=Bradyrhizobium japonicum TaxID=375 RepID=UPI0011DDF40E|nr:hypothetical protein [Bradyrhizobium japonicum]MCD9107198.1 hypothetical protein [Bradyrhizobium japonicum]MCD9256830.1 hypothetical protein [Bradyrhizobium japonicum SEMIA 5079]MCD9818907.1 hypothetical protein [Bradyrhizobium japonicum]MCD9889889.1 hypothetical protein [Bradyrhizobium japonicum]MCD9906158.1 hypothetical protein [Bradyrhizobium japonicum]